MDLRYPQLIDVAAHPDHRGEHRKFFGRTPHAIEVPDFSIAEVFMTVNNANVVRGLHIQTPPQPKVIQVVHGSVRGNILCCDPQLPEFGRAIHFFLDAKSPKKIYVPGLWAPGYRALEDDSRVLYLASEPYSPEALGVNPLDPDLDLWWGEGFSANDAVMAEKDQALPSFETIRYDLTKLYGGPEESPEGVKK